MVTDFTHINRFVIRPVHPFPLVQDIVQCIPAGTAFFAKMDAIHGYFQLALDEESSRLTSFLLPSGRYCYLQAPMALSSSSDEWCRHSDTVLEGLPYARKIVDDILVWAEGLPQLADRGKHINNVLSRKKFEIGNESAFAGLLISSRGIKPDPERIKASKRNAFLWGEDHKKQFEQVKNLLTSDMVVTHFNPNLPVMVLTDASKTTRTGFRYGSLCGWEVQTRNMWVQGIDAYTTMLSNNRVRMSGNSFCRDKMLVLFERTSPFYSGHGSQALGRGVQEGFV